MGREEGREGGAGRTELKVGEVCVHEVPPGTMRLKASVLVHSCNALDKGVCKAVCVFATNPTSQAQAWTMQGCGQLGL